MEGVSRSRSPYDKEGLNSGQSNLPDNESTQKTAAQAKKHFLSEKLSQISLTGKHFYKKIRNKSLTAIKIEHQAKSLWSKLTKKEETFREKEMPFHQTNGLYKDIGNENPLFVEREDDQDIGDFKAWLNEPIPLTEEELEKLKTFLLSNPDAMSHLSPEKIVSVLQILDSDNSFCVTIFKGMSDQTGLEAVKKAIDMERDSQKKNTFFRTNTLATTMAAAYQTHMMNAHMKEKMEGIIGHLPSKPYRIKEHELKEGESVESEQTRMLNDYNNMLESLENLTSSKHFPHQLVELSVHFANENPSMIGQLFFLRFFNPVLISNGAPAISLAKMLQSAVNQATEIKEQAYAFFLDELQSEEKKSQFNKILENLGKIPLD